MKPTILLNYDSGYINIYDTVYPLMNEYVFVGTAFIGTNFSFGDRTNINKSQYQDKY